jgi:peptidoglycan/xylan/chitin deacetylase (PgdA/CDA1 family)
VSELLVLCYHAISPTWSASLSVTPDAFERQISNLVRRGWTAATFTEVVRRTPEGKTVVLTFDDAFASVKTYALPVLRQLGVKATVFAPTDYISRQAPLAWPGLEHWERSPDANELTAMTWDDLGELAELGWEIGSHSRTHPFLTSLDDDALAMELRESREECATRIGRPVTAIAYPYGDVDDRVQERTRHAGYEAAAALAWPSPKPNRYRYPRIGVYHKDSWLRFRFKVSSWSRSTYGSRLIARRASHVDSV